MERQDLRAIGVRPTICNLNEVLASERNLVHEPIAVIHLPSSRDHINPGHAVSPIGFFTSLRLEGDTSYTIGIIQVRLDNIRETTNIVQHTRKGANKWPREKRVASKVVSRLSLNKLRDKTFDNAI
jgi:hypothetical protein